MTESFTDIRQADADHGGTDETQVAETQVVDGLSLASVAGTGGVVFAGVLRPPSNAHSVPTAPALTTASDTSAIGPATSTSTSTSPLGRPVIYQVGDAGWVTVDIDATSIALRSTMPQSGWTVIAATTNSSHINVQFTDTRRIVGVDVGLVGSVVTVSATNVLAAGSVSSVAATPVGVSADDGVQSTAPLASDVPVASPPAPLVDAPASTVATPSRVPARSATTATSAAGGSGGTSARGDGHDGASGGENDD